MGRGEHPRYNHHELHKLYYFISMFTLENRIFIQNLINKLTYWKININKIKKIKAYGQLVLLGFIVTNFTPIAYQRRSLRRPLKVNSS